MGLGFSFEEGIDDVRNINQLIIILFEGDDRIVHKETDVLSMFPPIYFMLFRGSIMGECPQIKQETLGWGRAAREILLGGLYVKKKIKEGQM